MTRVPTESAIRSTAFCPDGAREIEFGVSVDGIKMPHSAEHLIPSMVRIN